MKKFFNITAKTALSVLCLGVWAANAQNTPAADDSDVVIIEEEGFVAEPVTAADGTNTWTQDAKTPAAVNNDAAVNNNNSLKNEYDRRKADLSEAKENLRSKLHPDNQPTVDKALKNQNPTYNN